MYLSIYLSIYFLSFLNIDRKKILLKVIEKSEGKWGKKYILIATCINGKKKCIYIFKKNKRFEGRKEGRKGRKERKEGEGEGR